jgi:serine/threonine protein kinase/superfamily II DNA or RNA helicase
MLTPGTLLQQRYEILQLLGKGGFGAVYCARHRFLNREVAIKETDYQADHRYLTRFAQEAELLAGLRHQALPQVTDYFTEDQCAYLVMEYVPGENLGEYLARQPDHCVDVATALRLLEPLLDALAYLHSQSPPVIHRDIKHANIRICPDDQVYLVDFGIAKAADPSLPTATMSRAVTAGFSPVEQYSDEMSTDQRSDIYALGATLYYMLSGVIPDDALMRLRVDALVPLADLNDEVPAYLDTIVRRMLALWPDERYQDVSTLRRALAEQDAAVSSDRLPIDEPLPVPPETTPTPSVPAATPVAPAGVGSTSSGPVLSELAMSDILALLQPETIIRGPLFPGPVRIVAVQPVGQSVKVMAVELDRPNFHEPVLSPDQLALLDIVPRTLPFDGDAARFRLGIEAMRLGLAYEYDRYFSLSIARINPLPHQIEAVYEHFLKLPRIRFLLADDPGAGKTIMAGLLLKELKIRGLAQRVLIVAPANLTFQWQREMKDKFRETFDVVRSDVLRTTYGNNPFQEKNQVITSISWVSRIEDARDSLLRSRWDLVIVDEAHKMSAYSEDKKTLAYQLGEALSEMTDHYLLMTATPHKGDPENFYLFLKLLDADVYGDVSSLEQAIKQRSAPFYLRRVKEALVTFPSPEDGRVKTLFTRRNVRTIEFDLDADEWDFYDALSSYVDDQSEKAASDASARGRAMGFTMAMLQRRFASSIYAARRSLERMRDRREKILADPESYRQQQIQRKMPEDFDEMPAEEQQELLDYLETVVASIDPQELRQEIAQLGRLIDQAKGLEAREIETKLSRLKEVMTSEGVFADPKMKLLIFTEHKDTLDYLVDRLRDWNLSVTQIHGGMKIGGRDEPGTRLHAERDFREECQVLIATEAAGEGINLQFCWFMINYDIPWNPMRLEQRMGRIHRYGQEKDCLILNFVSLKTREGRVLEKLFERIRLIEENLDPERTGKVFNVLGDVLPSNQLERMVRDMYARNLTEEVILDRIVEQVDTERFNKITSSALEGLARRELNLSAILNKAAEARERRLVPEVIRDFFLEAAPLASIAPKPVARGQTVFRLGRVSRQLLTIADDLEPRFGRLGREYKQIVFDQQALQDDPTLEWVTPGHPLFECVREHTFRTAQHDLQRGAVFFELQRKAPVRLDIFSAAFQDGRGNVLHRRLFVLETALDGTITVRQPTIFLDLVAAPADTEVPDATHLPARAELEHALMEQELNRLLSETAAEREKEIATIAEHMRISLHALINRQNMRMGDLWEKQRQGDESPLLAANIKLTEDRLDELNNRLERRTAEIQQERHCTIGSIQHHGQAWVLPHPRRTEPHIAPMVRDDDIERIAVETVTAALQSEGWQVESVERENRGFDLLARRPRPDETNASDELRFIEVKGRASIGEVALSSNEYKTAQRLGADYWLYVVYNCASTPQIHAVQDPARLGWEPVRIVEHYRVEAQAILKAQSS